MKRFSFFVAMVFILSSVPAFAQEEPLVEPEGDTAVEEPVPPAKEEPPVEPEGDTAVEEPVPPAKEEPAVEKAAPAEGEEIPEQIVVEEGGIAVVAPVTVNVPRQAPPVVNVMKLKRQYLELDSIPVDQFKEVMVADDAEKSWCRRQPGWCSVVIIGAVGLVGGGIAIAGDQAGWFDTTTTIQSSR